MPWKKGGSHAISGFPISVCDLSQGREIPIWQWKYICLCSDEELGDSLCSQCWSLDVLPCHLCADGGEKATGKHVQVGCKAHPRAKQPHHKGKMCMSSSGSAGEGEWSPHRRNGHQLGVPGRQMHHDGRVTPPTAIVYYLSEQWFIWNLFPTDLTKSFPKQQQMTADRWLSNFKVSPEKGSVIVSLHYLNIKKEWDLNICIRWK